MPLVVAAAVFAFPLRAATHGPTRSQAVFVPELHTRQLFAVCDWQLG